MDVMETYRAACKTRVPNLSSELNCLMQKTLELPVIATHFKPLGTSDDEGIAAICVYVRYCPLCTFPSNVRLAMTPRHSSAAMPAQCYNYRYACACAITT